MKIGIDIDDTICDTSDLINQVIMENNLNLDNDFDSYSSSFLFNYEDLIRKNIDNILLSSPIKKDVREVISSFKQSGYEVYIITARSNYYSDNIYNITIDYLKKHGIIYDKLIFNCNEKDIFCVSNNIDIMLDDNKHLMDKLKNTNTKGILFNTFYNKNYDGDKVSSWIEFKEIVENWR